MNTRFKQLLQNNSQLLFAILACMVTVSVLLLGGISLANKEIYSQKTETSDLIPLSITTTKGDFPLLVEIADTDSERSRGLMYRSYLDPNQGMLFVFPTEETRSFWMKNTYIPLDIIFINKDKEVINTTENTIPHHTYPTYNSQEPAMYVLEVNAGFVDNNQINKGDLLVFQY